MKSRFLAVGIGALSLTGLAACGSEGGTGASPATTVQVQLSAPNYVTALPIPTTTTVAAGVAVDPANPGVGTVAGEQTYTVVGGDYLISIAKKHCISLAEFAAYNSIADPVTYKYNVGDVFKIPSGACAPGTAPTTVPAATGGAADPTATSAAAAVETTTTVDASAGATYTVVDGDYLGGIATKNGTTVEALMTANGWTGDPSAVLIYKGQKIKLPAKTG